MSSFLVTLLYMLQYTIYMSPVFRCGADGLPQLHAADGGAGPAGEGAPRPGQGLLPGPDRGGQGARRHPDIQGGQPGTNYKQRNPMSVMEMLNPCTCLLV